MTFAYIDPGSGTLLWQFLVSGLIGSLLVMRQAREALKRKLIAIWNRLRNKV